ncbi:MAG: FISUMP domain-containing protein [Planctomycetota bacterium]
MPIRLTSALLLLLFSSVFVTSTPVQAEETVSPDSFSIANGQFQSGDENDLALSDDSDLSISRSPFKIQSRVIIETTGLSPTDVPGNFRIRFEGAVFARSVVTQSIDLFNYSTQAWETIDSRSASRFADAVTEVVPTGDPLRFIEAGTGLTRARLRFDSASQRQQFAVNIDQIAWFVVALTATDADGNVYDTVRVGDQVWMAENLKTTSMNDGSPIHLYMNGENWFEGGGTVPMYQWADTSDLNNLYSEELPFDFYGAMYNEGALASGTLAPTGWRIPSEQDFIDLENNLAEDGHLGNEANVLKSVYGWHVSTGNGSDDYGFNALPNGYVHSFGGPTGAQVIGTWATSDFDPVGQRRRVVNLFDEATLLYSDNSNRLGAGIRCIRD